MPFQITWPSGHDELVNAITFRQRHRDYSGAHVEYYPAKERHRHQTLPFTDELQHVVIQLISAFQVGIQYTDSVAERVAATATFDHAILSGRAHTVTGAVFDLLLAEESEASQQCH